MKPTAEELIRAAPAFLGTPYSRMDCQAFVEAALRKIGIDENLAGSNAWYRHMTWTGTPEECKRSFGKIPPGAFLFILEHDGKEPEKYKPDGIGNASHIGIYTGMTGAEMCDIAIANGIAGADRYNFGNGAIHSSKSRGCVCTSKFAGKAIDGGWNRVGLWDRLSYDIDIPGEEVEAVTATVNGPDGETVFLRVKPSTQSNWICRIESGTQVTVGDTENGWTAVNFMGQKGYMMSKYLSFSEDDSGTISVQRSLLDDLRKQAVDLLKKIDEIQGVKS